MIVQREPDIFDLPLEIRKPHDRNMCTHTPWELSRVLRSSNWHYCCYSGDSKSKLSYETSREKKVIVL